MSFLGGETGVSLLIASVELNKHVKLTTIYKSPASFYNLIVSTCSYMLNVCFVSQHHEPFWGS